MVIRGGKLASKQDEEERNDENLALFSLFLSASKRICTVAEEGLEEDKPSFMAKSDEVKESM